MFIPASSTALLGVGHHDAGVASAVLNTSQQIGGSLGTALLNTLFAGAVTAYFADNPPASPEEAQQAHRRSRSSTATTWRSSGAPSCFAVALLVSIFVINAKKQDVPSDAAVAADAGD